MKKKGILKIMSALLALLLLVGLVTACTADKDKPEPSKGMNINFATLKGPTGIGAVKLMEKNEAGETTNKYTFNLLTAPDQAVAAVTSGEADIVAVPINLASTLYNKLNGNIQVLAINTLGVLSIIENGTSITSIASLKGKTIGATGKGATPQYILEYLLKSNGLDPEKDVKIEYSAEHTELATLLATGKIDIAMLPEPNTTSAMMQNKNLRLALNLTDEWAKVAKAENKDSSLVQGVVIARKDFVQANPENVKLFLKEYEESIKFVTENTDEAAALVEKHGIIPKAAIAKLAIPNSNITFISGDKMKTLVGDNLDILFKAAPASIGGKLPNDDFYFAG